MRGRPTTPRAARQQALRAWDETKLRLLAERNRVAGAMAVNPLRGSNTEASDQESDYASTDQIRDVEYSHREALLRRLKQLDVALDSISAGTYGVCAECGSRISDKRLASDPAVSLCIACQTASEGAPPSLTL
jgi:RNA polymerase-binding transcription factor DksA